MTQDTPARDFLLPRINAMLTEARGLGISREVAVAVLIDLVTGPGFNDVPLDPTQGAPPVHPDNFRWSSARWRSRKARRSRSTRPARSTSPAAGTAGGQRG